MFTRCAAAARDAGLAFGGFGMFTWRSLRTCVRTPPKLRHVLVQMDRIGVDSLTIVNVCAIFIGIVMTLQTALELVRFGAHLYILSLIHI